jgi:phage terminase large subunit GpA-like protein
VRHFDYASFDADCAPILLANAKRLDSAVAQGLRPPEKMTVAEWAEKFRRFPEESAYPGRWRHDTAPYLVEIMDCCGSDHPCEEVACKKCAQSGGSAAAENLIGHVADIAPGPMMYVQATLRAALDWADEKLWPMIEATPRLNPGDGGLVRPNDGTGSTKTKVKFMRGGSLLLAGANSAPSLRQHTMRYAIEDDLDQFPDDLNGQGSPEFMVGKRLTVYKRRGLSKRIKISTPTMKGASKIDTAYLAGDQRHVYLACQACGSRFDPVWTDIDFKDGPEHAVMVAPCCGAVHEHWQKAAMTRVDCWLATAPAGLEPPARVLTEEAFQAARTAQPPAIRVSFWISGLVTAFQTWADLAASFIAAQGDVNKLRAWTNLDLGDVFEIKGATPDHELLKHLKEQDWGRSQMPAGPAVTTLGADVQGDGIYYEIVGWAENAESWSLDAGFIPGATDVKGEGAWIAFDELARRKVAYPGGRAFGLDQICVDAGYHTEATEAFCRAFANRLPVFGRAGWTLPVLGRGEAIRYAMQGKTAGQASKRAQDKAYLVGTFGVKLSFYGFLRAMLAAAAEEAKTSVPAAIKRGRCHFSRDAQDQWFEQITAEHVVTKLKNGIPSRVWEVLSGRQNHWLDCRVYNYAAAEKLLLDTLTEADWARLRAERCSPTDDAQGDLLAAAQPVRRDPAQSPASMPGETNPVRDGWLAPRKDWL